MSSEGSSQAGKVSSGYGHCLCRVAGPSCRVQSPASKLSTASVQQRVEAVESATQALTALSAVSRLVFSPVVCILGIMGDVGPEVECLPCLA